MLNLKKKTSDIPNCPNPPAPPAAGKTDVLSIISQIIEPSIYHRSVVGLKIIHARRALGLSQQELANLCGCSKQFIGQIEASPQENNGKPELLTVTAEKIVGALFEEAKRI
jgi:DNA-binding XRE family transcriptional regulator